MKKCGSIGTGGPSSREERREQEAKAGAAKDRFSKVERSIRKKGDGSIEDRLNG